MAQTGTLCMMSAVCTAEEAGPGDGHDFPDEDTGLDPNLLEQKGALQRLAALDNRLTEV